MEVVETRSDGLGITNWSLPKERRHALLHSRLSKIDRSGDAVLIPDTAHGRKYLLSRWCYDTFSIGWQQRILASRIFPIWLRQHSIYVSPRWFRLYMNTFSIKNDPGTILREMNAFTHEFQVTVCPSLLERHCNALQAPHEHFHHVLQVLTLLHDAGKASNLNKCRFFTNIVDYLDYVIYCMGSTTFCDMSSIGTFDKCNLTRVERYADRILN